MQTLFPSNPSYPQSAFTTESSSSVLWYRCRDMVLANSFAALCVALATIVRYQLSPVLEDRVPFGTYVLAVIVVAWLGGAAPAVFALLLSIVMAGHFFLPPEESFLLERNADWFALLVFFFVGLTSIGLFHRLETRRVLATRQAKTNADLNEELRNASERKDAFLALLSHELRNPLASIQYASEAIQRATDLQSLRESGDLLNRNLMHLTRLVADLLDVTRYLKGSIELHLEPTDLVDCVNLAVEMNRNGFEAKRHRIYFDLPAVAIESVVDRTRITQIISNLISNAVKYTPADGRIEIAMSVTSDSAEIRIRDNGIGIDATTSKNIFEPFFQGHSKRARFSDGLGLGLSICQQLASLHDGSVEVFSEGLGHGTQSTLTIPITASAAGSDGISSAEAMSKTQAEDPSPAIPSVSRSYEAARDVQKVLVVDDDVDTTAALQKLLTLEGFEVRAANDGHQALRVYGEFRPDFVILDLGIPGMDGFEICKRLRKRPDMLRTKIIVVSGWGTPDYRTRSSEAGIEVHLLKPVTLSELLPHLSQRSVQLN